MHRSNFNNTDNNEFARIRHNDERIHECLSMGRSGEPKTNAKQWVGLKDFIVIQIIQEAVNTISLRLSPADGSSLRLFTPGELKLCISFKTMEGAEESLSRVYSITSRPNAVYYQITDRRPAPTYWTSNFCNADRNIITAWEKFTTLSKGSIVMAQPIFGPSLLSCGDKSKVAVFVTRRRGLISAIPLLPTAIKERPRVALFHEDLEAAVHPFLPYLAKIIPQSNHHNGILSIFYSRSNFVSTENQNQHAFAKQGTLAADTILAELQTHSETADAKSGADYYICGDGSEFNRCIAQQLKDNGVDSSNIFREGFGPFASP